MHDCSQLLLAPRCDQGAEHRVAGQRLERRESSAVRAVGRLAKRRDQPRVDPGRAGRGSRSQKAGHLRHLLVARPQLGQCRLRLPLALPRDAEPPLGRREPRGVLVLDRCHLGGRLGGGALQLSVAHRARRLRRG